MPLNLFSVTVASTIALFATAWVPGAAHAACADPSETPRLNVPAAACQVGQPCALSVELALDGITPENVKTTSGTLASDKAMTCTDCVVEAPAGYGNCNFNASACTFFLGDAFDPVSEFAEGTIATITVTCDEAGTHTLDLTGVSFGAPSGTPIDGCGQGVTIECTDLCEGVDCSNLDDDCNLGVCDGATGTCNSEQRSDGTPCEDGVACTSPDTCDSGTCSAGPDICPSGEFCDGPAGACMTSPEAEAWVALTYDGGINTSTFNANSMQVRNDSAAGVEIERVTLDLTDVLLPDIVFDPDGSAGDITAKCLEDGNGSAETGFVAPGDPCTDPFSSPFDDGYFVMEMEFTDFDPGETFRFAVDIDPTSIRGATVAGGSGSVSGLEVSGAVATIEFSNGATISGELFARQGSEGGGEAIVKGGAPATPTIAFVGIASPPQVVSNASQTVRVTGAGADADIRLLQIDGELDLLNTGGHDLDPFEANSAVQIFEYTATANGSGQVDIPVTLAKDDAEAGLNYFRAVVVDDDGSGRTGENSNVLVLELDVGCTQDSDCFDGDPCTDNTCNLGTGDCEIANNNASCDDGIFCNGTDTCSGGSCSIHSGDPCSGGSECDDSCNEGADNCFVSPGTGCTDDGNECTDDECNGAGNCAAVNNTDPCDDGLFCNGSDNCSGGSCSAHAGDPCSGGAECADGCSETDDDCFVSGGTPCSDDGDACTDNKCDGAGNCGATNNTAPCDDGDACTTGESCSDGQCGGGSAVVCNDGLFCNGTETCDSASGCLAGDPPLDCSGLDETCAMGACDEDSEMCESEPVNEGGICDDADVCTTGDECASGSCAGLPLCDPVCEACTAEAACIPRCGHPVSDPEGDIVATDALFILNASVGALACELCICDIDSSGAVVASDALRALSSATGVDVTIDCAGGGQAATVAETPVGVDDDLNPEAQ